MRRKGGITVFLALMMSVVSAFILLLAQTVRIYMSKSEAVYAVDNAVRSCFAEYNRELFERFHILLIDSSYKTAEGGKENTEGHFRTYLEKSISKNEISHVEMTGIDSANADNRYIFDSAVAYAKENLCVDPRIRSSGELAHFLTYIISVCGNDDIPCKPSFRTGEVEYILYGSESDDENIMWARTDWVKAREDDSEETYEDYLCTQLESEDPDVILARFSELVTEYMRENGSPGFDLDECYCAASFEAQLKCEGKQYSVERRYAYAKELY